MMYLKKLNSEDVNAQYLLFRDIPENINGYTNEFHGCSLEDYKSSVLPDDLSILLHQLFCC